MRKLQSHLIAFFLTLLLSSIASPGFSSTADTSAPEPSSEVVVGIVNINQASAEEIAESAKGIGLKKAQAIVAWREANGGFTHLDQLLEVKGIGVKTLQNNKKVFGL